MQMALIRHYKPSVRMEYEELDGLIRVIDNAADNDMLDTCERAAYIGAEIALNIIRNHELVEYPHQFLSLFEHYLDSAKEVNNDF